MDSFFGIDGAQSAASGLEPFEAEAGLKDVGLSLRLNYGLTERWSILASGEYRRLLGDAADSPIVADEGSADQLQSFVALGYRF
jgi:outer membrane scaffolding protein for murein synthesis (MipA/OmpV family)